MEPLPQLVTIGSMVSWYVLSSTQRSKTKVENSWLNILVSWVSWFKNRMVVPPGVADASAVQHAARSLRSWKKWIGQ